MRTPAPPRSRRRGIAGLTAASLVAAPLAFGLAAPANADVSTTIATFPYSQNWSNAGLITENDNWSGVSGVQGYLGAPLTTATGVDPQTLTAETTDTDVVANALATANNGGVVEVNGDTIAVQGSGSAGAPHVAFHLDLTGQTNVSFAFNAKDLDASADNAAQQIAVQYRVGGTGAYTNLPDGYIADATTAGTATQVTAKSVPLPAAVNNEAGVFVRVMTTNAVGNDELVGIDDIAISAEGGTAALAVTSPGAQTSTVGTPIAPLQLVASGGTSPYTFEATNLPAGLELDAATGEITGTPTTAGTPTVEITATDDDDATATASFVWTVKEPAALLPIAQIQGTGAATPLLDDDVKTQGVVTASFPTGGLNGFYIQTPGADTANASDAIFVYGGAAGFTTYPEVGDSVEVSGTAAEFSGQTQIAAAQSGVVEIAALGTVTAKTVVPGTDCALPGTACLEGAALNTAREVAESELFQPTAPWTATDVYDGSPFFQGTANSGAFRGEIGVAAQSTMPLVTPTEIIDAQATALVAERTKYNNAHRIVMDDGSSWTYSTSANSDQPLPWFTADHTVRVGAGITFPEPVVFTEGFNTWRILPQSQIVGEPTGQIDVEQTRPAAPENVGGDVTLATFNVLNFFPTTGAEFVSSGLGTCSFYNDRAGNPISNNQCNPNGPRGAANEANLERQRDKIVAAINTVDADIVSLEELENSVKFDKDRDFAINELVEALNEDAGAGTWAAVPSAPVLPPTADQDVIRNGFIYQPASVSRVGESVVLSDQSSTGEAFADAREPVAQAFKEVGTPDAGAFAVIVNHFKSKGSGNPDPDGQGNATDQRVAQANGLVAFADDFQTLRGIDKVFLAGDFNAYSEEDPIQVLNAAGYENLESTSDPEEETYNFDGMVGSLDHVLANEAALEDVDAVDVWEINGYESVYYEYARFNTNVTNLYAPNPFRSSDHSPEIIGINTQPDAVEPVDIQILATNDFHGRLQNDTTSAQAGAAVMAGAVKQLRGANPNTVFAAAGDLIGASTFESFIDNDKPTIDALNEAGLEVSAAGNHEFDRGYDDLVNRVMASYDADTNPQGGANWQYIAANVKLRADGADALTPSWTKTMDGVKVGFVGAVTEDLPELVTPSGIAEIEVTDIVTAVNDEADALRADGADLVVMLVHEGAAGTNCATIASDTTSDFGAITAGANANIDAIVSGHTHLAYNCSVPVEAWADRSVTERPVVSAGQYGAALNQLVFTVDPSTGEIQSKTQALLPLKVGTTGSTFNYPVDSATQSIVSAAVANANVLGARPLGAIGGAFFRAKLADGTTENRGGESTAGNLVAEIQRWATRGEESGAAQIAFMNPGGLRGDLVGQGTGAFPRTVTYRDAANVQPFANTLVNMDLTGAQLKATLEQQWQPTGAARPFLKLGISKGFDYTYDPSRSQGNRVVDMRLNGVEIDPTGVYSVTVNSFLSTGGDNFTALNGGTGKRDTGKSDLQAQVDYFAEFANTSDGDAPLPVDFSQRSVGVTFPAGAPASYAPGDDVAFDLSSLSMTGPGDVKDTAVEISAGDEVLGSFPVTSTLQTGLPGFDEVGTASVVVDAPGCTSAESLVVTGNNTGTEVLVPIEVDCIATTVSGTNITIQEGQGGTVPVQVTPSSATGDVILGLGQMTLETTLVNGAGSIAIAAGALPVGVHELPLGYTGDGQHRSSTGTVVVTVTAKPVPGAVVTTVTGTAGAFAYGSSGSVSVSVAPATATGTVAVSKGADVLGSATLASGQGTVALAAKSLPAGTHTLTLTYSGDTGHKPSTGSVTVEVSKADSTTEAKVKPNKVKVKKTKAKVMVTVDAEGSTPSGKVTVTVGKKTYKATLKNGKAVIKLKKFTKPGTYKAKVAYAGNANTEASRTTVKIKVKRR